MLFFRLGVEQRAREVGLLRAVGFSTPRVRRLFAAEGLILAAIGSVIGTAGAVAYGALMMAGLRSWWSGAVGTTALTLHVSPISLIAGAAGAIVAAMGCIWWTLRGLARISERSLLAGTITAGADLLAGSIVQPGHQSRRIAGARRRTASIPAELRAKETGAKATPKRSICTSRRNSIRPAGSRIDHRSHHERDPAAGAFFGAGASILIACLCFLTWRLRGVRGFAATLDRASRIPQHDRASGTQRARHRRHRSPRRSS